MDATPSDRPAGPARRPPVLHRILLPRIKRTLTRSYVPPIIIILPIAIITGILIGLVGRMVSLATWEAFALIIAAVIAILIVYGVIAVRRTSARRLVHIAPRRKRLAAVLAAPGARQRLPHRLVESAILTGRVVDGRAVVWDTRSHATALGPIIESLCGDLVVVIGNRDVRHVRRPVIIREAFEAVDMFNRVDLEKLQRPLRDAVRPQPEPVKIAPPARVSSHPSRTKRRFIGDAAALLVAIACMASTVALMYGAYRNIPMSVYAKLYRTALTFVGVAVVAAAIGAAWVAFERVILVSRTYLVPGGVVHMRHPFWRRRGTGIYARRTHTPLIWDHESNIAFVRAGGGVQRIPFEHAHLEAWFAAAPSPDVVAIQSLVGEDIDLVVAG